MKKIKLTQGQFALVDDEDYESLNKFKWHATKTKVGTFYARRNSLKGEFEKYKTIRMHNQITGFEMLDHIDGDGLNNQKSNLRECNHSQNMSNRKAYGKSGYKGVGFNKKINGINYYHARIKHDGKEYYLGYSSDPIECAKLYNDAALKHFGKFAKLNKFD